MIVGIHYYLKIYYLYFLKKFNKKFFKNGARSRY